MAATLVAGLPAGALLTPAFFDTVTIAVPGRAGEVAAAAAKLGINVRVVDADRISVERTFARLAPATKVRVI